MSHLQRNGSSWSWFNVILALAIFSTSAAMAQSSVNVRVMAANLNGNTQSYQPFALRILQGTKADVVCIQEFNYNNNSDADFRSLVDTCYGTNFVYYREPYPGNGDIPNGIISRYPIIASGSWNDTVQSQPNRGFAWAQIDLPGTNDLYVVSVHLLTSSAGNRNLEAGNLKALIQANFPANAWVIVAGDFNTDSRTESTMTTFDSFLSDSPVPADNNGNANTSGTRSKPHDYVLPSFSFTNLETATVFPSHAFPNGLVFDSAVYTPLSDVIPVQSADSGNAQHMAVMKDFLVPAVTVNSNSAPVITSQPQDQTVAPGGNVTFAVTASGTAPLAYQWRFNKTNIAGATTNPFTFDNAQFTNAGNYTVLITNFYGSVTSSIAMLTVSNLPPVITTNPVPQTVFVGGDATFTVSATGTAPLSYQWLFGGTNIAGANTNTFTRSNAQTNDAGGYSVLVTNIAGRMTSSVAMLTVTTAIVTTNLSVIAQWNFNSPVPDGNNSTGTTSASIGTGTASLVGGATATFATGDTTFDPAGTTDNSGWNTATYPAPGTGNKTRGIQFAVSTAGYQNIVVSWSSESPSTGSKYGRLQYSTNGTDFTDFPSTFVNGTTFTVKTNSLASFAGVNDNPNFTGRFLAEFESTAANTANANYLAGDSTKSYGTAGSMRYDMVTVSGTAIIISSPPASPAVLSALSFSAGQFQMLVTGTDGSNYVVQAATDLRLNDWISLFTNTAPFTFAETNLNAPQRYYRAIAQP